MSKSMLDFVNTYGIAVQKADNNRGSNLDKTASTAILTSQNRYPTSTSFNLGSRTVKKRGYSGAAGAIKKPYVQRNEKMFDILDSQDEFD